MSGSLAFWVLVSFMGGVFVGELMSALGRRLDKVWKPLEEPAQETTWKYIVGDNVASTFNEPESGLETAENLDKIFPFE